MLRGARRSAQLRRVRRRVYERSVLQRRDRRTAVQMPQADGRVQRCVHRSRYGSELVWRVRRHVPDGVLPRRVRRCVPRRSHRLPRGRRQDVLRRHRDRRAQLRRVRRSLRHVEALRRRQVRRLPPGGRLRRVPVRDLQRARRCARELLRAVARPRHRDVRRRVVVPVSVTRTRTTRGRRGRPTCAWSSRGSARCCSSPRRSDRRSGRRRSRT